MYHLGTCVSATICVVLLTSTPAPSNTPARHPEVRKPPAQERFLCVQEQCKIIDDSAACLPNQQTPLTLNNKALALLHPKTRGPMIPTHKLMHPVYRGERFKLINPVYNGERVHIILLKSGRTGGSGKDVIRGSQSSRCSSVLGKVIGVVHRDPPSKKLGGVSYGAQQKQP